MPYHAKNAKGPWGDIKLCDSARVFRSVGICYLLCVPVLSCRLDTSHRHMRSTTDSFVALRKSLVVLPSVVIFV